MGIPKPPATEHSLERDGPHKAFGSGESVPASAGYGCSDALGDLRIRWGCTGGKRRRGTTCIHELSNGSEGDDERGPQEPGLRLSEIQPASRPRTEEFPPHGAIGA
jgi:hypothetical protein